MSLRPFGRSCALAAGIAMLWSTALAAGQTSPAAGPAPSAPVTVAPPPYVAVDANLVEFWSRSAIAHLARRWGEARDRQVVVAHFGDSHVQKGYITEAARRALEEDRGFGGRGMVFPYAIAKTYSQADMDSSFTGTWRTGNSIQQPPRLPVGIAGFAARTTDPDASVTITFKQPLDPGPKRIRLFYSAVGSPYELTLTAGGTPQVKTPSFKEGETASIADFDLDGASSSITLQIHALQPATGIFTLRGISVENSPPGGVLYHNLGVGGAVYQALLQQTWFDAEIKAIKPDLVILDWGTNDLLFTKVPSPAFEQTVLRTIARIRHAAPDADILLTSPQDMMFRGHGVAGADLLSAALRRIAADSGCLYWDWYRISGGPGASSRWRTDTLLGSDGIHLTSRGYRLKGRLLGTALLATIDHARTHPAATMLEAPAAMP